MDREELREKRRRAGAAGGRATAERRRAASVPRGTLVAGPGPASADGSGLVYGTAAQLRQLAEAMTEGDQRTTSAALSASTSRVAAFRSRHPNANLETLTGRPICETATVDPPAVSGGLRIRNAGDGTVELWIDDVITYPNSWGEGVSFRDVREALEDADGADLCVHMNCPGGDVFEGVAIYQAFRDYPGDVYIAVDALAASAASFMAMAGDTVGIGNLAMMMIHEASGFAYGNSADMLAMAGLLDKVSGMIASAYAGKVPETPVAAWRELMVAETWFDAAEALTAGLADERLDPAEEDEEDADATVTDLGARRRPAATSAAGTFLAGLTALADPAPSPTDLLFRGFQEATK